jgi:hypothetical protein
MLARRSMDVSTFIVITSPIYVMTLPPAPSDRTLHIYLALAQYPILKTQIRARMRRELFGHGIITPIDFEAEVKKKAIRSQKLEALGDPFAEEPADIWDLRLARVRDNLTDFYFAYNLPHNLFERIIKESLAERGAFVEELQISFNPELAPQNMLFEYAIAIEQMPPKERAHLEARLQEIKVVLIRTLISDQLGYVKIARDWLTISDLEEIRNNKIGHGKIGGKAAGMLLASRILNEAGDDDVRASLQIPESYYVGADLLYNFMALNDLMHWADQKYKPYDEICADFPQLQKEFAAGQFPPEAQGKLQTMLEQVIDKPLIVRSSSLLEDNFGTSFAGKYDSYFCPNQGTSEENLLNLTQAIQKIYASALHPDALLYRHAKGLLDYDERMALLIQVVQGEKFDRYFLPHAAGVAFSRNLYRWSPQIRRDDGFVRLVWGLGTRAVDRVGSDYPRLVALSHPMLHPESTAKETRYYSQRYVDLIDLQDNAFKSVPVDELLSGRYPVLRYIAQVDRGGYLAPIRIMLQNENVDDLVITFDGLLSRTPFANLLTRMLAKLEEHYHSPVDTEFTIQIKNPSEPQPEINISLLQCRPQSHLQESNADLPLNLPVIDIIFSTHRLAPQGKVSGIRYVIFISPEAYFSLPTLAARGKLGRMVGRLNAALEGETFICIGPGRWGTNNPDLGVHIGYSDIYNTRALVEITGSGIGSASEASFGTHFFQDLVESNIYPLAVYLDDEDVIFNKNFFYKTPNRLGDFLPDDGGLDKCLRLIEVSSFRPKHHMELVMDNDQGRATAFLEND